jgi:amino-acid N-acetyltransferase
MPMTDIALERARPDDLADVLALLREQRLPTDDLDRHLDTTLVARKDGRLVGSVAVEVYADGGLLRSVAVAGDVQGQGLGRALTHAALALARQTGLRTLYLLTTTAENYFPKFGFETIARDDVPASVRTSVEFTSACPSSAVVMRKAV